MIKTWLKILGLSFASLIFFLIVTFPYSRLGPKLETLIERDVLKNGLGVFATCRLEGFDLHFPLQVGWDRLRCAQGNQVIWDLKDVRTTLLPFRQTLSVPFGKGELFLKTNFGFGLNPDRVILELTNVPLAEISSILLVLIRKANPFIPSAIKIAGTATGTIDLPLRAFQKARGLVDLQLRNLSLPQQNFSDLLGLKDVSFSKSAIRFDILAGRLAIRDIAFLSDQISGKAEGQMELQDDLKKSSGTITLKWKITKSDALLSAPLGQALASAPCQSPDSEGFCTYRVQRLGDLFKSTTF